MADLVQPGASPWGTDWLGETKVPSSLGLAPPTHQCAHVGHLVAFGSTEEWWHRVVLGCRQRGVPADGPFDHRTGKGHVPFHKGDYSVGAPLRKQNEKALYVS